MSCPYTHPKNGMYFMALSRATFTTFSDCPAVKFGMLIKEYESFTNKLNQLLRKENISHELSSGLINEFLKANDSEDPYHLNFYDTFFQTRYSPLKARTYCEEIRLRTNPKLMLSCVLLIVLSYYKLGRSDLYEEIQSSDSYWSGVAFFKMLFLFGTLATGLIALMFSTCETFFGLSEKERIIYSDSSLGLEEIRRLIQKNRENNDKLVEFLNTHREYELHFQEAQLKFKTSLQERISDPRSLST